MGESHETNQQPKKTLIKPINGDVGVCGLSTRTHSPTKKSIKLKKTQKNIQKRKSKNKYCINKGHENSVKNNVVQNVPIFSANCAGLVNKIQSLVNNVTHLGAGVITLQETHFKRKGRLNDKLNDFEIFEAIRKKQKGGTLIGVQKNLDPILIEEYSEEFELLVVEVKLGEKDVRIISGYGPQENWKKEEKMPFFRALEEEVVKATMHGKGIYIELDANSKLGPTIIEGDPHPQSENGKILSRIIKRHALLVVNNIKTKCKGTITSKRTTKKSVEESVIDFVIVNEEVEDLISELIIDEEKKYVLTSYRKCKNGVKVKESDHNTMISHLKSSWNKKVHSNRIEMYNFKDENGLKKFKEITSKNTFLSEVFMN